MMCEDKRKKTEEAGRRISRALQTDPGGRGLLAGPVPDRTELLLSLLQDMRRVYLISGFPVRREDGEVVGETDGPSGIAHIAWALEQRGVPVLVMTDQTCIPQMKAALKARGCRTLPSAVPAEDPAGYLRSVVRDFPPTHLITLERPGKARDGHFYNMRGGRIDAMLTDTDSVMEAVRRAGGKIISVGDGGNELGMGALRPLIEERVPHGELICADAAADAALVSGVSNWWGWGLAAFCSLLEGRDLLPSPETERKVLQAVIEAGGADGCTGRREETVDALPAEVHLALLQQVSDILRESLS